MNRLGRNKSCGDFDVSYTEAVGREVIGPIAKHYFRLKLVGLENLPATLAEPAQPLIFLANHAGRCLPWDAILLDYALGHHWVETLGAAVEDKPRSLAAPELSAHPLLVPFRLSNWWRRVGCLDATARNFHQMLREGQPVIIFPEGIAGIGRDFSQRYQLLPFSTSVVRMATHYNAQVVPISIVGSEYFHPYARQSGLTNFLAQRLRLPFLHLSPFTWLLPLAPWLLYMALPAPVTIVVGQPYSLDEDGAENANWEEATQKLQADCQRQLNEARSRYEQGWNWLGLVRALLSAPEPAWKLLPFAWPYRFINHARHKAPQSFPQTLAPWRFLIPVFGWLGLNEPIAPKEGTSPVPLVGQRKIAAL